MRTLLSSGADSSIKDKEGKTSYEVAGSEVVESVYKEVLIHSASQSK